MNFTIRPVERGDVAIVIALVTEVLGEFGLTFGVGSATDDALRALPESYRLAGGKFWVANDARGALVGTCAVYPLEASRFELRKMYLAPSTRGSGLGARLLSIAIAFATERGARELVLDTTEKMERAIAFYERHGFVRDDAQIRGARCTRGYRLALSPEPAPTRS